MVKKILLSVGIFTIYSFADTPKNDEVLIFTKNLKELIFAVDKIDLDEAFNNVCTYLQSDCKEVKDLLYKKLKKNDEYKKFLYYIALTETELRYRQGLYDKDDISFFQINYRNNFVRYLAKKYKKSKEELKYDTYTSGKIALSVFIMNSYYYIKTNKVKKNLDDKILLCTYHRPFKIEKNYYKKVSYIQDKYKFFYLKQLKPHNYL